MSRNHSTLTIGLNVRAARKAKGMSLTELARRANISKAYLSQMENYPEKQPSAEIVYRLARALDVHVTQLMGVDNGPPDSAREETAATASSDMPSLKALPNPLRIFWRENPHVPAEDVAALADLSIQGWNPATPTDFWLIYTAIRAAAAPYREQNRPVIGHHFTDG